MIAVYRVPIALVAVAFCALSAVPAALGKENVRATLECPLPLEARPGTTITVAWALSYSERDERRPFGAGGVFVRLRSASGEKPTKAHGEGPTGRYVARVQVPEGGIGGIEFGLEGTRYVGGGPGRGRAEDADVYFPLDNDPFLASRSSGAAQTTDAGWPVAIWLAAIGALCALVAGIIVRRASGSGRLQRRAGRLSDR